MYKQTWRSYQLVIPLNGERVQRFYNSPFNGACFQMLRLVLKFGSRKKHWSVCAGWSDIALKNPDLVFTEIVIEFIVNSIWGRSWKILCRTLEVPIQSFWECLGFCRLFSRRTPQRVNFPNVKLKGLFQIGTAMRRFFFQFVAFLSPK